MLARSAACLAIVLALTAVTAVPARAAEHIVRMLNFGPNDTVMVFDPPFVRAAIGDTIRLVPTDPYHNAQMIEGMWPEGAPPMIGELSKEVRMTVTREGVYGIQCLPHYAMGMVAVVVVGRPVNLEQARKVAHPEMAQPVMAKLLAQAEAATR